MPTPPVPSAERSRRKSVVEGLLQQGYHPQGSSGGIASATKEAERREGINYPRWVREEEASRDAGKEHFSVDWSLYVAPESSPLVEAEEEGEEEVEASAVDHAYVRARELAKEISVLVTSSYYPLINPDAILVDSHLVRKYDRETFEYVEKEGTPRTWLTETLKVSPVEDCRNRKYLFTGAQNDALVHEGFWENLQAYATYLGAEIVVGPWTYETQWWSENNPTAREYASVLSPYLCFGQMRIGSNFIFAGEMNTLPTASAPISDLVTYSRGKWAVFPHAKRQLKSVPSTDPFVQAHQVMTSGAVTRPKVIPRKAGVKSLFHHVIGATLVEFDEDGDIFCRQITAGDDGSFYDLDRRVADGLVTTGNRLRALICADIHTRKLDPINTMATFGWDTLGSAAVYRNNIVDTMDPEHIVVHDIHDNEPANHHHINDNAYAYEMAIRGRQNVAEEVFDVGRFVKRIANERRTVIVAEGNHDIALELYARQGRWRNDGINIRFGLELERSYLQHVEERSRALDSGGPTPRFSLLEHAIRHMHADLGSLVEWAHDGYSRLIDGIECGHHGFRGANGAKGTVSGFAKLGRKINIGDKHSPEINEGVYVSGAMNLRHGYNRGPSGWAVTHIFQYQDGKRSLVTLQKGKWCADRPIIRVPAGTSRDLAFA
jgi:hypothetical protein